jgi:hypothetical protein
MGLITSREKRCYGGVSSSFKLRTVKIYVHNITPPRFLFEPQTPFAMLAKPQVQPTTNPAASRDTRHSSPCA